MKTTTKIHIQRKDRAPVALPRETVIEYLREGILTPSALARHDETHEWKPLVQVLHSAPAVDSGPLPFTLNPRPIIRVVRASQPPAPPTARLSPPQPPEPAKLADPSMPPTQQQPPGKSGPMIALNLILVAAVIIAAWVRFGSGGKFLHQTLAPANPAATSYAPAPPAQIAPVAAPGPPSTSQPAPAPALFDPSTIAADPHSWPLSVRLTQPVTFPAVFISQVVGSVSVPAGTAARLVGIQGQFLELEYQGALQKVPWQQTDLEAQVRQSQSAALRN